MIPARRDSYWLGLRWVAFMVRIVRIISGEMKKRMSRIARGRYLLVCYSIAEWWTIISR
jgi:hypothetical protein